MLIKKRFKIKNKNQIKKALKSIILQDKKNIKKLEKIIHPLVRKKMRSFTSQNKNKSFLFYEIPLLIESKLMKYFNVVIFIKAKKKLRFDRFKSKSGDKKLFSLLNNKQMPDIKKIKYCDYVVVNKDKNIIIHNASFDLGFLDGELGSIQKEKINKKLVIDSLELARNKFPGTSNSLDALCKRFNIDLSRRNKHNALLDCELLREVYINLLDAKEPKFNLSNNTSEININRAKEYNKKVVKISDIEIQKHKEFLKSELKKNFY